MRTETFAVLMVGFAILAALPFIFFRTDGKLNLKWWLTASPMFASGAFVLAGYTGIVRPISGDLRPAMSLAAVLLSAASIGLMWYTLGTHRIPISLFHQDNDAPREIVTWGAYRRIRHPFYSSFLMLMIAAALAAPGPGTAVPLLGGVVAFAVTARREERRLLASTFAQEYRDYLGVTGRFLPVLKRAS